jgi:Na+/H+-dicarboxylate symporter
MLTPLFLAIGLPPEGIGILIAVDAIPDVFATVLNTTGDLAAAALVARSCNDSVDNTSLDRTASGEPEPNGIIARESF